jgi:4-hydroxy-4-methyl-2-oxoglutarate aldolase
VTGNAPAIITDALRAEVLRLGSATLYEASRQECTLPVALRPAWPGAQVAGAALPVRTAAGDNLPLHLALEVARAGEVLVVDAAGVPHGYWGEVLTVAAQQRGVLGLVIDGGVRDTAQLERLRFPVFSRWVALEGTVKNDPGTVGAPITLGATRVCRGDLVVADRDGIVVVPARGVREALAAARARARAEAGYLERLRAGELTTQIYGFSGTAGEH